MELTIIVPTARPFKVINGCIKSIYTTTKNINYEIIIVTHQRFKFEGFSGSMIIKK